ncbi:MAG: hypothetical protein JWN40_1654 [Phycisphaerales bacterium]|nr:hypothetical protein [Phycisphaerales bacterium]
MASISRDKNTRLVRILVIGSDGKRRAIRVGKLTAKQAEGIKVKVEALVHTSITRQAPDAEVSHWLTDVDDVLYNKLAAAGLVEARGSTTLDGWLKTLLDEKRLELKAASIVKLEQTKVKLLAKIQGATPLRSITPGTASAWRSGLIGDGLSEASVKIHVGNAKTIFAEALTRRLVVDNPFGHLVGGNTPSQNTRFVTAAESLAIFDACPDSETKLIFGLARLAGLRTPSETHLLTWADVDWKRGRLHVRSPKTERHAGHETRVVPITPQLMQILQDHYEQAAEGESKLVTLRGGALVRRFQRIIKAAGIAVWADLFQTLRRSCEKAWAMQFPQYAVSRWIGHSIAISGRHYANAVPDELFDKAAMTTTEAAQNPAQQASETVGTGPQSATADNPENAKTPAIAGVCVTMRPGAEAPVLEARGIPACGGKTRLSREYRVFPLWAFRGLEPIGTPDWNLIKQGRTSGSRFSRGSNPLGGTEKPAF